MAVEFMEGIFHDFFVYWKICLGNSFYICRIHIFFVLKANEYLSSAGRAGTRPERDTYCSN